MDSPSCGLVDPAVVTEEVYAAGEGHTVHVIDGVDPRVMVAWDNEYCGPPLDGRWRVMFAADQRGSTAENDAWCQASLNGPIPMKASPAEGAYAAPPMRITPGHIRRHHDLRAGVWDQPDGCVGVDAGACSRSVQDPGGMTPDQPVTVFG